MIKVNYLSSSSSPVIPSDSYFPSEQFFKTKRTLTEHEKRVLISNNNRNSNPDWKNIYVSDDFDPGLICDCEFSGIIVIGRLKKATLQYHDLVLEAGLYHSKIHSSAYN